MPNPSTDLLTRFVTVAPKGAVVKAFVEVASLVDSKAVKEESSV